jgi:hypothetical protein
MFDLNDTDMLSKIHQYKLDRQDGWCNISVHEIIASENAKVEYIAVPNLAIQQSDKQYFGIGENVEEALRACLTKIKSVAMKDLFPHLFESQPPATE